MLVSIDPLTAGAAVLQVYTEFTPLTLAGALVYDIHLDYVRTHARVCPVLDACRKIVRRSSRLHVHWRYQHTFCHARIPRNKRYVDP